MLFTILLLYKVLTGDFSEYLKSEVNIFGLLCDVSKTFATEGYFLKRSKTDLYL